MKKLAFRKLVWYDISNMAILQGFLDAVVALMWYCTAILQIGAAQTGAFGTVTPIQALIGGSIFLDEAVTLAKTLGAGLVIFWCFDGL